MWVDSSGLFSAIVAAIIKPVSPISSRKECMRNDYAAAAVWQAKGDHGCGSGHVGGRVSEVASGKFCSKTVAKIGGVPIFLRKTWSERRDSNSDGCSLSSSQFPLL